TMLLAFDSLASCHPECRLSVVGEGDRKEELIEFVDKLEHSEGRVSFIGYDEPERWLKWADVFLLPSTVEGMSNALIESMSYGVLCVANDIPPNREVLDDGKSGVLVPVGDVSTMANAIKDITESPLKYNKLQLNGFS